MSNRHQTSAAAGAGVRATPVAAGFAPAGPGTEATRLAKAVVVAAEQRRHSALLVLSRQAASDPELAATVIGQLAYAVADLARLQGG